MTTGRANSDGHEAARSHHLPAAQRSEDLVVGAQRATATASLRRTVATHPLTWRAIAAVPLPLRRQAFYLAYHRRWGHFRHPRTFNEKVNWRILYDRRAELTWTCDKLRTKERADRLGVRTIKTLWAGTDVSHLSVDDLPPAWVMKPNNSTGLVFFGETPGTTAAAVREVAASWASDHRAVAKGEWAYTQASPGVLLEERLGPIPGSPADFKVFVFDGEPYLILVDIDRFAHHMSRFYTPDWRLLPFRDQVPVSGEIPRPSCLPEMLEVATVVAGGLDFLRVDLFVERGQVYLGEVTAYPGGGLEPFQPRSADFEIGSAWRLPSMTSAERPVT